MIKKSLISFLGFFFAFECCLRFGLISDNWITSGQSIWSINVTVAQNYLYKFKPENYNCVIGSSISCRLKKELLPKNLYVLSFNGLSVYDGLYVLWKKETLPDTLFVETNVLERPSNNEFRDNIGRNKIEVGLKQYVIGLREAYAPLNLITQIAASAYIVLKRKFSARNNSQKKNKAIELMRELEVDQQKRKVKTNTPKEDLTVQLMSNLQILEKKGVTIVLFDMPVDCHLDKKDSYYNEIYARGKRKGFLALKRVKCTEYKTSDGTHLEDESADKYTKYFLQHKLD